MPTSVGELIDFVVGRVLDLFELPHNLNTRWSPSSDVE
jgi:3-polyprenyl-4-hydroxybenzoate decarboxylase